VVNGGEIPATGTGERGAGAAPVRGSAGFFATAPVAGARTICYQQSMPTFYLAQQNNCWLAGVMMDGWVD
jgi:hypothetical protein